MNLLSLVITLIIVGILLWCVNKFIPMDEKIKTIVNIVVVVSVVCWLLAAFGLLDFASNVKVPRVK